MEYVEWRLHRFLMFIQYLPPSIKLCIWDRVFLGSIFFNSSAAIEYIVIKR